MLNKNYWKLGLLAHSRAPITTPPNVVMGLAIGSGAAPSPSSPSIQVHEKREHLRNNNSSPSVSQSSNALGHHHHHHTSASSSSSRQAEDPQTAAQRQAAAKLALRKQLEKTLLQVTSSFDFDVLADVKTCKTCR